MATQEKDDNKRKTTSTCCGLCAVEGEVHLLLGVDAEQAADSGQEVGKALGAALHLQLMRLQEYTAESGEGWCFMQTG